MLNPTFLQTLGIAFDRTSSDIRNTFTKICSVEILIAKPSFNYTAWETPNSVESVESPTIVAIQRAEKKSWFAIYVVLVYIQTPYFRELTVVLHNVQTPLRKQCHAKRYDVDPHGTHPVLVDHPTCSISSDSDYSIVSALVEVWR